VLCKPRLETPVIRESRYWRVAINRNQDLLGKTMVLLRRHEELVTGLKVEEWADLRDEVIWLTERLRTAFLPDHFNYSFLMNADRHVHLHVIPRYVGSRQVAGIEFEDPEYPAVYQAPPAAREIAPPELIAAVEAALAA
jgi:diadenosine tetraphosphate (Ap4A) HIT family hydrolase